MTDTPSLPEHLTTSEREALFPLPDPALAGLRARLVQQADDVVDHAEAVERLVGDDQRATESLAAHDIHRVGEATGADHVFGRDEEGIGAHRSSPDCVWMAAVRAAARFLSDCEPGRQKKPRAWGL